MKIKKYLKVALASAGVALVTSCQDWLTVYPQTQVVEENFWEDKNDLEGVRYAAYKQMCNTLEKLVLWGELRSDSYEPNYQDGSGTRTFDTEMRWGRLERDSANAYFEYTGIYTTINYCNKVLQHGAEVLERDKQFTPAEWQQMKAEITALRALNYFYLIRAFKDVPYSTRVVNSDADVCPDSATNQLVVLDSLILDVENVRGMAAQFFTAKKDTKGLITNAAISAMLSDMYLWRASLHQGRGITTDDVYITNLDNLARIEGVSYDAALRPYVTHTVAGDYERCVFYADQAMQQLVAQTEDNRNDYGVMLSEICTFGLQNCRMYKNEFENFMGGNTPALSAYTLIFDTGNSDESIFELQFSSSDNRSNGVVTSLWGAGESVRFEICENSLKAIYNEDEYFFRDSRTWFSAAVPPSSGSSTGATPNQHKYCFKWSSASDFGVRSDLEAKCRNISMEIDPTPYSNWIVYRLSDVMLQKAEALVQLGRIEEALCYVNAIHRRWYCNDVSNATPVYTTVNGKYAASDKNNVDVSTLGNIPDPKKGTTAQETAEIAVMNERQIEFLGEGKRWYDLVRYAERHAGGQTGVDPSLEGSNGDVREWTPEQPVENGLQGVRKMVTTFMKSAISKDSELILRIKNRYGLYNLIHYMEIKASKGHLQQNPAWDMNQYEQ